MENGNLVIKNYNANQLIFSDYNPRQLTENQYKSLTESIEKFGFVDPVIVNVNKDRKNIIVGGHQRVHIAQELGIEDIPCVEVNLEYDRERELNVRLNKNIGGWDFDILANEFEAGDLLEWGFSENELQWSKEYEPTFSSHLVDDAEMEKRDQELRERWKADASTLEVCCPDCGHEFQISDIK